MLEMRDQMGIEPAALASRPHLDAPLAWYLEVFWIVSRGRTITMGGAGPIPLSELFSFMQIYEIDSIEDRAFLVNLMGELDDCYLEHQAKKQGQEK